MLQYSVKHVTVAPADDQLLEHDRPAAQLPNCAESVLTYFFFQHLFWKTHISLHIISSSCFNRDRDALVEETSTQAKRHRRHS